MKRVERVIAPVDLLGWLKAQTVYPKLFWASREGDFSIAALGQAAVNAELPYKRFGWRHFLPTASLEWRDFPSRHFYLPRFEVSQKGKKIRFAENHRLEETPLTKSEMAQMLSKSESIGKACYRIRSEASLPDRDAWMKGVERAGEMIRQNDFQKVVTARRITFACTPAPDPFSLCRSFEGTGRTVFLFQPTPHSTFLGATPELLYRRKKRSIEFDAMAGTRAKGCEKELLASEKEMREFTIVRDRILSSLSLLCHPSPKSGPISIVETPTVCHLYSRITGELRSNVTDEMLIDSLHPTPAVGGWPRAQALSFLSSFEPFARGLYAAPIGWMGPEDAEIAIGIRSCLIESGKVHLFAGTGIVNGSDPLAEWNESELKLEQWRAFFT